MSDESEPEKDLRVLAGTKNPKPKFTRHDKIMAIIAASPPLAFSLLWLLPFQWRLALTALVSVPVVAVLGWYGYGRVTGRIPPPKPRVDFRDTESNPATGDSKSGH